VNNEGRTFR